jgi:hypothetical protein
MAESAPTTLQLQLRLAVNLFAVTALPFQLGLLGQSLASFLAYVVGMGSVLALAEQPSRLSLLLSRPDVRAYLQVRVVLVLVCGALPYLLGVLAQAET